VAIRSYRPKEVMVHPHGDTEQRIVVLTYAAGDATGTVRPPSRECLDHLLRGARRWGLPVDYIAQLEQIKVVG